VHSRSAAILARITQEGTVGKRRKSGFGSALEAFAVKACDWSGRSGAFVLAIAIVVVWLACGPMFGYSNTWQLIINTGTTIVTFLMVFLIQRAQNKDALATQLKLNELVAAVEGASNRLVLAEELSEEELQTLRQHYRALAAMAAKDERLTQSHSVEEAESRHAKKMKRRARA
jgi:low affinity Fe/Cu permease